MSIWIGKFRLPDVEAAECDVPRAFELKQLRAVGLNPEEWLVVRLQECVPFVILKKRGVESVYLVLSRGALGV